MTSPTTTTSMPVNHFQIVSANPAGAADFYRRVFGWTISGTNPLAYQEVATGGINGGIWPSQPGAPSLVQLFVDVPDVAAAVADAGAAGGRTVVQPVVLPDGDEIAVILDPDGLPFGLVKRKAARG